MYETTYVYETLEFEIQYEIQEPDDSVGFTGDVDIHAIYLDGVEVSNIINDNFMITLINYCWEMYEESEDDQY